jgi:hypothetical protein
MSTHYSKTAKILLPSPLPVPNRKNVNFDTPDGPLPLNYFEQNFQDIILAHSRAVKNTQKCFGGYLKKSHFFHRTP